MLGLGFDYKAPDGPATIFPHLFVFLPAGKIFLKSWTIGSIHSVFDEERDNEVYTRNYVTYSLNRTVAVGPQFEAVVGLGEERTVFSLIFGVRITSDTVRITLSVYLPGTIPKKRRNNRA